VKAVQTNIIDVVVLSTRQSLSTANPTSAH